MAASAYGGQGPLVLGITWTEAGLALILIGLRAKTACFCRPGQLSSGIFGVRWDFFWVILGVVHCPLTIPQNLLNKLMCYR